MKFFKHSYAVRGTQKDINSRLKAILEAGFAVRGDINSRWKAILDAGYAVHGNSRWQGGNSRWKAVYAVRGTL